MMVALHRVVNPRTIDDEEMKIPRDESCGDEKHREEREMVAVRKKAGLERARLKVLAT
jgi:hypothetical protein